MAKMKKTSSSAKNIESKIQDLKSKVLNNPYENIMYNDQLKDTKDLIITEFSPVSIDAGSSAAIDCEVPPGIPVPAGTLRSMGGTFMNVDTGQVFVAGTVIITDPKDYTTFQIQADSLPAGDYSITILLGPMGKVGDVYRLTSDFNLTVKPVIAARIAKITPNTVSLAEIGNTTFTITGKALNTIQTSSGFYLQSPAFKFQFAGALQETTARVRYISSNIPEPGPYRVLARNSEGNPILSQATLTIEE